MRHAFGSVASLLVLTFAASAGAQTGYVVSLQATAGGNYSSNDQHYLLQPGISATNNGSSTTAQITFTSPSGEFQGFVNDPSGIATSSYWKPSTAATVSAANGTWDLQLQQGNQTYHYNVGVSLTLPFANLPRFTSPELINGQPYNGTIHFGLADGSSQYPGSSAQYFGSIYGGSNTYYGSQAIPAGSTAWTPSANLSSESTATFYLTTTAEAVDTTALQITSVTPVTGGAPSLSFASPTMRYFASVDNTLAVPEPATAALMLLGTLTLRRRRA